MERLKQNIGLISAVHDALGEFGSSVVYVGGAVAGLLITSQQIQDVRPTDDVDVIAEAVSYGNYVSFIEKLRPLGFTNDMNGPLCRYKIHGITVDIMPTEENILGFSNRWYKTAIETAVPYLLPAGQKIQIVNAPLFLCTKLEAFADRGRGDFLNSADIEDIVTIINGRDELVGECWGMSIDVRKYLRESFEKLQNDQEFLNALPGLLPYGSTNRDEIVAFRISQLALIPLD